MSAATDRKTCDLCGVEFGRRITPSGKPESITHWAKRRFCSVKCSQGGVETRLERFLAKVDRHPSPGCWQWSGAKSPKGYGRFGGAGRRTVLAHRFSYEHFVGPIPTGLELDHLCRNPWCVNPAHLEPVTSSENKWRIPAELRRRPRGPASHCRKGLHEMVPGNLYIRSGRRQCRQCALDARALRRAAQRAVEA